MLPASLTGAMGAWILARKMRVLGERYALITVPVAIGARYESRAAQGLAAIAILIATTGYMAPNFLALAIVVDTIFGTGHGVGGWIGVVVTLADSITVGVLAGAYTDIAQS